MADSAGGQSVVSAQELLEKAQPPEQRGEGVVHLLDLVQLIQELSLTGAERSVDEVFTGRVVPVQGCRADSGPFGDVIQGRVYSLVSEPRQPPIEPR